MPNTSVEAQWFGHPRGLSTLFFTEMWERFSYYGMRALLVLFMTDMVASGGLGMTDVTATAIYGLYTFSVYAVALPAHSSWFAGLRRGASQGRRPLIPLMPPAPPRHRGRRSHSI